MSRCAATQTARNIIAEVVDVVFIMAHLKRRIKMRIADIKYDPEFQSCLPELSTAEYTGLEKSIVKYGVQSPVTMWNGYLVDGHNRVTICEAHGIKEIKTIDVYFDAKEDVIAWILSNQLSRRNLTDHQRNVVALRHKEIIAAKAKERQVETLKQNQPFWSNDQNGDEPINTRRELAKIAGTNETSIRRSEYIEDHGTEEQKERAMKGGKGNSVSAIAKEIKQQEKHVCERCRKSKPEMDMIRHNQNWLCKDCVREEKKRYKDFAKSEEFEHISKTVERIKSGETTPYTPQNVLDEMKYCVDGFILNWKQIVQEHMDIVSDHPGIIEEAREYLDYKIETEEIDHD